MAIKTYKPYTPSRRYVTGLDSGDITAKPSVPSLLKKLPASAGRNNNGRITSRHREAGAKKLYRIIDFKRTKFDIPGRVDAIEYDHTETVVLHLSVMQMVKSAISSNHQALRSVTLFKQLKRVLTSNLVTR